MERGEKGGVVIDGDASEPVNAGAEGAIDAEIAKINEDPEVIDEQGDKPNADGGTKVLEDGKVDGEKEGSVEEEGADTGAPEPDRLGVVEKTLEEIRAKMNEKPQEKPQPMTNEQWENLETETGMPRRSIEFVTNQNIKVINRLTDLIESRFAKMEVGSAIDSVAKDPQFTDASRYKTEINEFLADYEPRHWTNPALIKKATIYARGLNANKNIQKVRTDQERNLKVAGAARPSSPNSGSKKPAMPALTASQREAATLMGVPEAEYSRIKSRPSRQIE